MNNEIDFQNSKIPLSERCANKSYTNYYNIMFLNNWHGTYSIRFFTKKNENATSTLMTSIYNQLNKLDGCVLTKCETANINKYNCSSTKNCRTEGLQECNNNTVSEATFINQKKNNSIAICAYVKVESKFVNLHNNHLNTTENFIDFNIKQICLPCNQICLPLYKINTTQATEAININTTTNTITKTTAKTTMWPITTQIITASPTLETYKKVNQETNIGRREDTSKTSLMPLFLLTLLPLVALIEIIFYKYKMCWHEPSVHIEQNIPSEANNIEINENISDQNIQSVAVSIPNTIDTNTKKEVKEYKKQSKTKYKRRPIRGLRTYEDTKNHKGQISAIEPIPKSTIKLDPLYRINSTCSLSSTGSISSLESVNSILVTGSLPLSSAISLQHAGMPPVNSDSVVTFSQTFNNDDGEPNSYNSKDKRIRTSHFKKNSRKIHPEQILQNKYKVRKD